MVLHSITKALSRMQKGMSFSRRGIVFAILYESFETVIFSAVELYFINILVSVHLLWHLFYIRCNAIHDRLFKKIELSLSNKETR